MPNAESLSFSFLSIKSIWYVDFYYSSNGYTWILAKSALALGFTPAYVGLGLDFEISTGTTYDAVYDWFRGTQI